VKLCGNLRWPRHCYELIPQLQCLGTVKAHSCGLGLLAIKTKGAAAREADFHVLNLTHYAA
jgi:hypothetical protein